MSLLVDKLANHAILKLERSPVTSQAISGEDSMLFKSEFLERLYQAAVTYKSPGQGSWGEGGKWKTTTEQEKLLTVSTDLGLPLITDEKSPIIQVVRDFPFHSLHFRDLAAIESAWEEYQVRATA